MIGRIKWRLIDMAVMLSVYGVVAWYGGPWLIIPVFIVTCWAYADGLLQLTKGERERQWRLD